MNKVAIVGMGYVGKSMLKIFPDAYRYDLPLGIGDKVGVNQCDMAVVCVPTPSKLNGDCDVSIVEDVVRWLETPLILVKSALEPGTADMLESFYNKRIVVSPEYVGESKYFVPSQYLDPVNPQTHGFLILGGKDPEVSKVADIFAEKLGPTCRIRIMEAVEAELIKYAENSFFATKVIFANELRSICEKLGANWHRVREGWIDDPRIGPMHTAVFPDRRGYGGKCYPKDTLALVRTAEKAGFNPILIKAVIESNKRYVGNST